MRAVQAGRAASLIVAVTVVPVLCRIFLKSSRASRGASLLAGVGAAVLGTGLCQFVWGPRLAPLAGLPLGLISAVIGLASFGVGYWMSGEKI